MNKILSYKVIEADFNENLGVSYVKISTRNGIFEGSAYLHPDDEKNPSKFFGCACAESRAYIKALKHERKLVEERIKQTAKILNYFSKHRDSMITLCNINKDLCQLRTRLESIVTEIEIENNTIKKNIADRDRFIKQIHDMIEEGEANKFLVKGNRRARRKIK